MDDQLSESQARRLFEKYSAYVFKTALLLTKSRVLADDVLQETFIQVFRKYHTFDSSKPFEPWLYRITVNVAKNMMRKQKWLTFVPEARELIDVEAPAPVEGLLNSEKVDVIKTAINQLKFKSREVIVLHFFAGLTLNEISETLGIPLGTCKSRLNSALTTLRKKLDDNDFFELEARGGCV
ncbi:RNA polymerase sigma24 factor [Alicyclobacillus acidoterrestris]|uniref:RNA polymerase sigma factor n=1 Tax=Alicyclobacillus suci TaxID=2816080 RepID=UPI0011939F3D|nr:sigma-70 family RNA polymerase sigma factor [Alicyclobacillus suci]GEO27978.1 RNA polymerase sigma24 factor [Alicyclobacillus acidoterrestris]